MGSIMRDVFGCDCQVARFITNMTRIKRMLRMRMDQGLGARRCIPSRSRCMPVVFVALAVEAHMSRKPSPSKCHSALNTSQENCLETPDTLDILLPCHSKPVNGPISPESSLGVDCIEWSMSRPSHPLFGEHRSNGDRWPSKSAPPCGSSRKELDLHLETRARDHLPWGSPEPSQIVSASLNEREREDIGAAGALDTVGKSPATFETLDMAARFFTTSHRPPGPCRCLRPVKCFIPCIPSPKRRRVSMSSQSRCD